MLPVATAVTDDCACVLTTRLALSESDTVASAPVSIFCATLVRAEPDAVSTRLPLVPLRVMSPETVVEKMGVHSCLAKLRDSADR